MIKKDLQEFQDEVAIYKDTYKQVLSDSLNAHLLLYLEKTEEEFTENLKKALINKEENIIDIIFDFYPLSAHGNIYFQNHFDDDKSLVGVIAVQKIIKDHIYKHIFGFEKQIECTYTNYKRLLKESENIDPFLLEDLGILEQVLAESPSLIADIRRYYENNGFTVKMSPSNIRVITLSW